MATKVTVPRTGYEETEVVIGMWFKREGEKVSKGEALCTIETEKASVEIESLSSGVLRRILCPADTRVRPGDVVAIVAEAEEDISTLERESRRQK